MKRHDLLIRLHQNQVDDRRRELIELERLHESMLQQAEALEREILAEQDSANASPEAATAYGAYAALAVTRRANLQHSIAETARRIDAAKDAVMDAFRTLKKHEIVRDRRIYRARRDSDRREQGLMDEIALGAFRRQQTTG
jgi:flagellar export protein FliJ